MAAQTEVGNQVPRLRLAPPYRSTAGQDAGQLGEAYGLTPDPWQQGVLDDWLGENSRHKLTAGVCCLAVPRQNGKNAVLEIVELFKMTIQGRRVLHTAHEVKTARKAFMRLRSFFENQRRYPDLAKMVKSIRSTNGQEAIFLHHPDCPSFSAGCGCDDWGSVEFVARSRGSGRGFTVDDLVCDEWQELTDEQLEALLPTISAAPSGDPQQIYTGTPPGPTADGSVAMRQRAQALAGAKRMSWTEFSIEDSITPSQVVTQWRKHAKQVNPALGIRLGMKVVQDEVGTMSPEGFCRERLGWWDRAISGTQGIPRELWAGSAVLEAPESGVKSFAVVFSADGKRQSVAGALKHRSGVHVEIVGKFTGDTDAGVLLVADWLAERKSQTAQISICGKAGAATLKAALRDRGVPNRMILILPTQDYLSACSMFLDGLKSNQVSHPVADETDVLERSVKNCMRKERGGAWGWQPLNNDGDETPLEAVSVAYLAAKTTKRRPGASSKRRSVL